MLRLPAAGEDPTRIDFSKLPVVSGDRGVVTVGAKPWGFRLHSYLVYYGEKYWCMWSQGPVIEDRPTQHVRCATSADGLHWSQDNLIVGPSPEEGTLYIARGFWVREGRLTALASLHNKSRARASGTPWSEDLQLLGFEWDSVHQRWGKPQLIFADTLSNFPPRQLPTGQWAMIRRDHHNNIAMLVGGTESLTQWTVSDIMPAKSGETGFKATEPDWWILPDGRVLGVFRDGGGSKRLFRAVSNDDGRTWTKPERTNFPDANSKFFCLRTSRGCYVLVSNPNPAGRNPLCLAISEDGVTFSRLARLPEDPSSHSERKVPTLQYPHVIEQDGSLLICYSRRKTAIEVIKVSLEAVERLRHAAPTRAARNALPNYGLCVTANSLNEE